MLCIIRVTIYIDTIKNGNIIFLNIQILNSSYIKLIIK